MKKNIYAIVDLETTGGQADKDRITEIAIAIHDGEKVIDSFETLINPERTIPYNITQITGISQEMVQDAPKFFEVAKKVVQLTEGKVFVAHNVRFDYNFLRAEFRRLGYTYTRKLLCTVRLSRKTFPWIGRYSLGHLIKYFKIEVNDRHRAMADVMATVNVFERILDMEEQEEAIDKMVNLGVKESKLPPNISLQMLHDLPEETGVYYFHDKNGEVIYVGKSINIKSRVMQHFADQTPKGEKIASGVHQISFEITGSELIALLKESRDIKAMHPKINRAQRARNFPYIIYLHENDKGYLCVDFAKVSKKQKKDFKILREYPSLNSARGGITRILEQFELCQKYCHIDSTGSPCFYYHIHKCRGACIEEESTEDYNARVLEAIETLRIDFTEDFLIYDKGRTEEEKAVVLVEDGEYRGYGFIEISEEGISNYQAKDVIDNYPHNPDVAKIIQLFLSKGKVERVVKL